jgi:hypothetical protein
MDSDDHYRDVHLELAEKFDLYGTPIISDNDCCPIPGSPEKLRKKAWTALVSGANPSMLVYTVTGGTPPLGLDDATTQEGIRYTGFVRKLVKEKNIDLRGMRPRDDLVANAIPQGFVWALAGDWALPPGVRPQYLVYFYHPGQAEILELPTSYEAWWFDPVAGNSFPAAPAFGSTFITPQPNHDWVLYIDGGQEPQEVTVKVVADAYVDEERPTTNLGSSANLSIRNGPIDSGRFAFIKFNIPGFSGSVTSAKLRIRTRGGVVSNLGTYEMNNMTWSESTINWLNWDQEEAVTFTSLGSSPSLAANTWHEIDVSTAVTGSGTLNFGLASGTDLDQDFWSRESAYKPQLRIERLGQPTLVVNAAADSWVSENQPTANFGSQSYLRVRYDPVHAGKFAFLKFEVPPYPGTLLSATLRFRTSWTDIPSAAIYRTSGMEDFNEGTINWLNWDRMGAVSFSLLDITGVLAGRNWHEIDVTNGGAESGATLVLGLATGIDQAGLNFWGRESLVYVPELVITYQP